MEPQTANSSCLSLFLLHSSIADVLFSDNLAMASAVRRSISLTDDRCEVKTTLGRKKLLTLRLLMISLNNGLAMVVVISGNKIWNRATYNSPQAAIAFGPAIRSCSYVNLGNILSVVLSLRLPLRLPLSPLVSPPVQSSQSSPPIQSFNPVLPVQFFGPVLPKPALWQTSFIDEAWPDNF